MTELSKLFQQAKGEPIEIDGRVIHAIYRWRILAPATVKLSRVRASPNPIPGIRLRVQDGTAVVDGEVGSDLVFWSDTAPTDVELEVRPNRGKTAELRLWNCWRDRGVMQAWLSNAGMLVEEESETTLKMRCNSGPNTALSFDDLIVEVTVLPQ